jgi:hypothetical protein
MSVLRRLDGPTRLGTAAVLIAALACGVALADAWRLEPLPKASAPVPVDPTPPAGPRGDRLSESLVLTTIAQDPFRADRKRPPERYRPPAERVAAAQPQRPELSGLRLLGTAAVDPGGGLAAFQVPGQPPRVFRVGEEVAGFRLAKVGPGQATLTGRDTVIVLRLAIAAAVPGVSP